MEVYVRLEAALAVIEREENWSGRASWHTGGGDKYCAVHALETVGGQIGDLAHEALQGLVRKCTKEPTCVGEFNDTHTHVEVVALFQTAIAQEKKKAGVYLDLPSPQPDEKTGDREKVEV